MCTQVNEAVLLLTGVAIEIWLWLHRVCERALTGLGCRPEEVVEHRCSATHVPLLEGSCLSRVNNWCVNSVALQHLYD